MHITFLNQRRGYAGLLFLLALLPSAPSFAARTYHIEAIVFERAQTSNAAGEVWRDHLALAYNPDYRIIKNPSAIDDDQSLEKIVFERPAETYKLNAEANALARKSGFRVLFHKAWQQTLTAPEKAPAVVITGGDSFDNYFELSGTMTIGVSKFLHVSTDLWLTRFGPNLGGIIDGPTLPLTPDIAVANAKPFSWEQNANGLNLTQYPDNSGVLATGTVYQNNRQAIKNNYLPQEIIVMAQSRRMRSKEMHYIDHPRLGVLLKIYPMGEQEILTKAAVLQRNQDNRQLDNINNGSLEDLDDTFAEQD